MWSGYVTKKTKRKMKRETKNPLSPGEKRPLSGLAKDRPNQAKREKKEKRCRSQKSIRGGDEWPGGSPGKSGLSMKKKKPGCEYFHRDVG